jgi:hypothetical protein
MEKQPGRIRTRVRIRRDRRPRLRDQPLEVDDHERVLRQIHRPRRNASAADIADARLRRWSDPDTFVTGRGPVVDPLERWLGNRSPLNTRAFHQNHWEEVFS